MKEERRRGEEERGGGEGRRRGEGGEGREGVPANTEIAAKAPKELSTGC